MKEREILSKNSVEMFEGRSMFFLTTVHIIFTILLFVTMTHVQMQMTSHIAQQERENKELREILSKHKYASLRNGRDDWEENTDLRIEERNIPQHNTRKSKEMDENEEVIDKEDNGVPLTLRNKRNAKQKCCGRGQRGAKGPKGSRGKRGRKGQKGDPGIAGAKGDKGERGPVGLNGNMGNVGRTGPPGSPGNNGDKGSKGQKGELESRFSQSAHIIGVGGAQKPSYIIGRAFLLRSWTAKHTKGQMTYSNGYLTIGQTGYYYIYCQLFSVDGDPTSYRFSLYVGNNEVLKAFKSIISSSKRYNTNYIGGVFQIQAGQTVSVRTQNKNLYFYGSTESYFGAFMIHP